MILRTFPGYCIVLLSFRRPRRRYGVVDGWGAPTVRSRQCFTGRRQLDQPAVVHGLEPASAPCLVASLLDFRAVMRWEGACEVWTSREGHFAFSPQHHHLEYPPRPLLDELHHLDATVIPTYRARHSHQLDSPPSCVHLAAAWLSHTERASRHRQLLQYRSQHSQTDIYMVMGTSES